MLPIYIPSRGRAGILGTKKDAIQALARNHVELVVPAEEAARYRRATSHLADYVFITECPVQGIDKVRHWIGQLADKRKQPKFVMIDDDIHFCIRKSPASYHLRPAEKEDVTEMLQWIEKSLDNYAHVSVSPRGNNLNNRSQTGDVESLALENKRLLRVLAYRTKEFLSVEHGRVPVMEDFDVTLQLIRAGYPNLLSYWYSQDQRETGSIGGCSSYRTLELHEAAAKKLAELHAPFVQLRKKVNKSSTTKHAAGFKERTEVTIYWEKAAASAPKRAA